MSIRPIFTGCSGIFSASAATAACATATCSILTNDDFTCPSSSICHLSGKFRGKVRYSGSSAGRVDANTTRVADNHSNLTRVAGSFRTPDLFNVSVRNGGTRLSVCVCQNAGDRVRSRDLSVAAAFDISLPIISGCRAASFSSRVAPITKASNSASSDPADLAKLVCSTDTDLFTLSTSLTSRLRCSISSTTLRHPKTVPKLHTALPSASLGITAPLGLPIVTKKASRAVREAIGGQVERRSSIDRRELLESSIGASSSIDRRACSMAIDHAGDRSSRRQVSVSASQGSVAENGSLTSHVRTNGCRVAVVGAGAAGLVAARELIREGHDVSLFEQQGHVGGVWVYEDTIEDDLLGLKEDRRRVHTSMYANLRTNLPRELMSFTDFPFLVKPGRDSQRYCGHEAVAEYLTDFTNEFSLWDVIHLNTAVVCVEPERPIASQSLTSSFHNGHESSIGNDGKMLLDASEESGNSRERWVRWTVTTKKEEKGAVSKQKMQSGLSGEESYSADAEEERVEVFDAVVVCSGHYVEPNIVDIPGVDVWPGLQMHSHNYRRPEVFADKVIVLVGASASGDDISLELATVAKEVHLSARNWDGHGMMALTQPIGPRKNHWLRSMVERACADGSIIFKDGSSVKADVIIHCTGYFYKFPFLKVGDLVTVDSNAVGPLYQHVFSPEAPSLSFVGLPFKVIPFPLCEIQSFWIAQVLAGKAKLPSTEDMLAAVKQFYEERDKKGIPKAHTHEMGPLQTEYIEWILSQCKGGRELESWRGQMFADSRMHRRRYPESYRDTPTRQDLYEQGMAAMRRMEAERQRQKLESDDRQCSGKVGPPGSE